MEIDKASQPQKPDKPTGLGQWGSAQFDSSDQQQKFLRLMGGFKKGSQPVAASSDGANMALGKDAQQQLQQGLLGDFERAQSRRMDFSNRGSGLGFNAPTNKKLSIDVNACRSVRFDDWSKCVCVFNIFKSVVVQLFKMCFFLTLDLHTWQFAQVHQEIYTSQQTIIVTCL